jgi:outer membrane immunogenic protein
LAHWCGTSLASAADLPARRAAPPPPLLPVFTWSGFYIGAHAGAILDNSRLQIAPSGAFTGAAFAATNGLRSPSFNQDDTDGTGGVQAGYNFQFGSVVAGVEADIGRGPDRRNNLNIAVLPPPLVGSFTGSVNSRPISSARGVAASASRSTASSSTAPAASPTPTPKPRPT